MAELVQKVRFSLRRFAWLAMVLSDLCAFGQGAPAKNISPVPTKKGASPAGQQKLSPEQERGLRLLKASEAEAAGLQPDMHAFVLWRVATVYARIDPKRAEKVALDTFTATQSIEDPTNENNCGPIGGVGDIKSWIQEQVLSNLVEKEKTAQVEQLLPQATEPVRNTITKQIVRHYTKAKDFARAQALLARLADSSGYPFDAAADLLLAMGPEQSADRMMIFHQAMDYFEQQKPKQTLGPGDVADFVDRTWTQVPAAMALEAINKILEEAKTSGSKSHYSMSAAGGSVMFNSDYEMRLFQLLPALQAIDKDKADQLLRDDAETKARLAKYPKGMQSLNTQGGFTSFGVTDSDAQQSVEGMERDQVVAPIRQRTQEVIGEVEKDPQRALADALVLPVQADPSFSPRASALSAIAFSVAKKKPSVARAALDEIGKVQDQLTPEQMSNLATLPPLYMDMGDEDGARKVLKTLLKAAEKMHEHDLDADDPNKAFKGTWPSTDLWRQCVRVAAKISPALAEEIISNLPDPDIAAAQKVAFASSLLGVTGRIDIVSDCRKGRSSFSTRIIN
jgi:hypothetical protein